MSAGPKYQCPVCEKVLQSLYRHHFDSCGCDNKAFVDGGSAYLRTGWKIRPPIPYVEPA